LKANPAAFEIGEMAQRMATGYFMHAAVIRVASDPRAPALSPNVEPGQIVPVDRVVRKDGTQHVYHFTQSLAQAASDPVMVNELRRVWLVGALLAVGDALRKHGTKRRGYFNRAPELELLRHLRNGVAHGNTFKIYDTEELKEHAAHNRQAAIKSDTKAVFEITPNLEGQPVLFDFIGPGDVLDLLMSVSIYLIRMGNGDPLRP
jgi:hypothetical protein